MDRRGSLHLAGAGKEPLEMLRGSVVEVAPGRGARGGRAGDKRERNLPRSPARTQREKSLGN